MGKDNPFNDNPFGKFQEDQHDDPFQVGVSPCYAAYPSRKSI